MRTAFTALATLLFALTALSTPVAEAEAEEGLREHHHHHHHHHHHSTVTVKHHHTSTKYEAPAPAATHKHKHQQHDSESTGSSSEDSLPSGDSGAPGSDEQSVLDRHNKYRKKHGVSPLEWSDSLA